MCLKCQFCHNMYANARSLRVHQARTKACLALRGKEEETIVEEFVCYSCNKSLTSAQNLKIHLASCKSINEQVKKELDNTKKIVLQQLSNLQEKDIKIQELNIKVQEKEKENDRLSKLLEKALTKPTITNNDNRSMNVVNFLKETNKPITLNTLMRNSQYLTMANCLEGGNGLAKYYIAHPFKEAPIICTDSVRKNFSYLIKKHGVIEIVKDKKLCNFNPKFFETIMKDVEHNITKHLKIEGYDPNKASDQVMIAKYLSIINDVKASAKGKETKVSADLITSLANRTGIDLVRNMFSGHEFESDDEEEDREISQD